MSQQEQSVRLFLLRHGPTTAPKGCFAGSTDLPLSGQGLSRLRELVPHLQKVTNWYCSPMQRTCQTLDYLQQQGCQIKEPVYDARLREINFGVWEMKSFAEIAATDAEQILAWQDYEHFAFPQGESVAAFLGRIREMLTVFVASGQEVAAVTHGGVIRAMICMALGLPPRSYLLFDVQPASLTVLDLFSEGAVLRALNLPGNFSACEMKN